MTFSKKTDQIPLIQVRNLVKQFDAQTVLNGVDLDIVEGDLRVIMGPSGCGKSTLLRCFNRLVEPTSGSIVFKGQNIMDADVDVRALRQSIGFVFQQFALYRHLNVVANITLALRKLKGMSKVEAGEKAMHELERFNMAAHRDKYPAQLSGGQMQRVAIARALAMDPAILVLDEPTSALDPVMSREVGDLIQSLHQDQITMVLVTHDLTLAEHIAPEVSFLDQGKIMARDSITNLSAEHQPEVIRSFFGARS
jgi:polar amino acid transport system ATP-binding protein